MFLCPFLSVSAPCSCEYPVLLCSTKLSPRDTIGDTVLDVGNQCVPIELSHLDHSDLDVGETVEI